MNGLATNCGALGESAGPGAIAGIRLNGVVAAARGDCLAAGLALMAHIKVEKDLSDYYWLYASQADLRRLDQWQRRLLPTRRLGYAPGAD